MSSKSGWDFLLSNEKLEALGDTIREDIIAKTYTEIKTFTVDGKEYTVPVTVCPPLYGTGYMGTPMNVGKFNFNKSGNKIKK